MFSRVFNSGLGNRIFCERICSYSSSSRDLIVGMHGKDNPFSKTSRSFFPPEFQDFETLCSNELKPGATILQKLSPFDFPNGEKIDRIGLINVDQEHDNLFVNQYPYLTNENIMKSSYIRKMVEEVVHELCSDDIIPEEILVDDMEGNLKSVVQGTVLGLYDYKEYIDPTVPSVQITPINEDFNEKEYNEGMILGECQNFVRYLAESPANMMTPKIFCKEIIDEFEGTGLEINERDENWARENNFNLFLGVSRGSENPPRVLEGVYYGNKDTTKIDLALIGKGITFDSGGYNLKTENFMRTMKGDMDGAAVVWSALKGLMELEVPINVAVVTPLCENMVSGKAQKPGDVITARNGLTVELENTDAEGRLILADALSYAEEIYDPEMIIDVATLTGAISIALGEYTGAFSNSNILWERYLKASLRTGEYCWRMPMFSDYKMKLESNVADLKNLSSDREAGSSVGAMFLNEFVDSTPYLHLDIGGSHYNENFGMTGNTTSTIIEFGKIVLK